MAVGWFRRNVVGPLEWDDEAMGSVVWVQCATSAECKTDISAVLAVMSGQGSSSD